MDKQHGTIVSYHQSASSHHGGKALRNGGLQRVINHWSYHHSEQSIVQEENFQ
jgi:hypothetical protein